MKKKGINLIIILLLAAGIFILFYPYATAYETESVKKKMIAQFKEENVVDDNGDTDTTSSLGKDQLYTDMLTYNKIIYENGQIDLVDPFSYETTAFNLSEHGIEDEIFGIISIPKLNVELPILLGASKVHMEKGAANLGNTSIPIGGNNTNAVLAAHRGYKGLAMFRDIEAIELGDEIYITNLWETLAYKVVEIKVILPTNVREIYIREGRDMVTLITCHPYTQNDQRYVVYCERTADEKEPTKESDTGLEFSYLFKLSKLSKSQRLIFAEKWIPIGIAVILLIAAVSRVTLKRKHNRKEGKPPY